MSKHTPGPWELKRILNFERDMKILKREYAEHQGYIRENDGTWIITDKDGQVARATFKGEAKRGKGYDAPDPEGMANARLIAAAPELLMSLQNLVDVADTLAETANLNIADNAIKYARAAIAKAT